MATKTSVHWSIDCSPGWYPFWLVYNQLQAASLLPLLFLAMILLGLVLSLALLVVTWPYRETNAMEPDLTWWACPVRHTNPKRKSTLTFCLMHQQINQIMVTTPSNQVCAAKVLIWTGRATWAKAQTPNGKQWKPEQPHLLCQLVPFFIFRI